MAALINLFLGKDIFLLRNLGVILYMALSTVH